MMQPDQGGSNFLAELLGALSRRSGITFDYVPASSYEEALALVARGDADVISDVYTGPQFLAQNNLVATKPYHDPPVMLAGLDKAVPGSGIRVGSRGSAAGRLPTTAAAGAAGQRTPRPLHYQFAQAEAACG